MNKFSICYLCRKLTLLDAKKIAENIIDFNALTELNLFYMEIKKNERKVNFIFL